MSATLNHGRYRWSRQRFVFLVVTGCAPASLDSLPEQRALPPPASKMSLVFDGVTVVDVEHGQLLPGQRVAIVGNRIIAVGDARTIKTPQGAQVVDARGKYLMPGLWDMHVHPKHLTHLFYPLLLTHGVTGIRDAGSGTPLDTLTQWRREILAGTRVGPPRQILAGKYIQGGFNPNCQRQPEDYAVCLVDSADARHYVDSLRAAGADMIKLHGVPWPVYAVVAAEARRQGIPFGGHLAATGPEALEASDSGVRLIDHTGYVGILRGLDTLCWNAGASVARCQVAAERFRRNETWWTPTLVHVALGGPQSFPAYERLATRVRELWAALGISMGSPVRPQGLKRWNARKHPPADSFSVLSIVQRAGLPVVAGTDVGPTGLYRVVPGLSLHTELEVYVAEGLTTLNALQSATINPAKLLEATDSLGTVAPGKLADLVLLEANPLEDITNTTTIRAVVANGHYFDRATLDQLLVDVRAEAKKKP